MDAPSSAVAALHIALLDAVRGDWGIPGTVGADGWHAVMRSYLREDVRAQRAAGKGGGGDEEEAGETGEAGEEAPKATPPGRRGRKTASASPAGKGKARAAGEDDDDAATLSAGGAVADGGGGEEEVGAGSADGDDLPIESDPDGAYPPAGYWGLPPAVRVRMLRELVHDVLDTGAARAQIEAAADAAGATDRALREELAAARRDARAAWAKQRDQQVGALLADAAVTSMTADEQRAVVARLRARVEAKANAAAAARVRALAARAARGGREVRAAPLGRDREGAAYYDLPGVTAALAGAGGGPALLVCAPPVAHPGGPVSPAALRAGAGPRGLADPGGALTGLTCDGVWGAMRDGPGLAAALDGRGEGEGPLRVEVLARWGLAGEAEAAAAAGEEAAPPCAAPADVPAAGAAAAAGAAGAGAGAAPDAEPVPAAAARGPAPRRGRPPKAAGAAGAPAKRGTKRAPKAGGAAAAAAAPPAGKGGKAATPPPARATPSPAGAAKKKARTTASPAAAAGGAKRRVAAKAS